MSLKPPPPEPSRCDLERHLSCLPHAVFSAVPWVKDTFCQHVRLWTCDRCKASMAKYPRYKCFLSFLVQATCKQKLKIYCAHVCELSCQRVELMIVSQRHVTADTTGCRTYSAVVRCTEVVNQPSALPLTYTQPGRHFIRTSRGVTVYASIYIHTTEMILNI